MSTDRGAHPTSSENLWPLLGSPTIWACHFLACYCTAAVYCAKIGSRGMPLGPIRWWVLGFTIAALAGIAVCAFRAVRSADLDDGDGLPHDASTIDDRRRFVSWSILLLSGLSAVGVIYGAMPAALITTCI